MKYFYNRILLISISIILFSCGEKKDKPVEVEKVTSKEQAVLDFINQKFGMFIHFNMSTFQEEATGGWATPNVDPKIFAPTNVDCNQWAKAAKSAKMNYAVFTTKHHDGFCLWDSKVTDYDIANSTYQGGDIVKKYADAFRKEGIKVGLYFSVWDRTHEIEHDKITEEKIQFTKDQLTELLTNYGKVECIVIDGWGSKWGKGPDFEDIPYATLADHIHSIQPNCLVINHSCRTDLDVTQVVHYEATHGQHCPYDNTIPSQQGPTIQPKWFWEKGNENGPLKSVKDIKEELNFANAHYSNYLLNAAPNAIGLMDDNVVERLKEVGASITLSAPLAALPELKPVHQGVTVRASSYSNDNYKPENVIDCDLFTRWQYTDEDQERWVELDFGEPKVFNRVICGAYRGGIEAFKVEALVDGQWKLLTTGTSLRNNFNRSFDEVNAQKYRLVITEGHKFKKSNPMLAEFTLVKY
ncbi:alpha-L-fucosidase [Flavivirga amylovorans]|uniref:alpha-L-fucosidase n=1 Tax=Flavivirga amylovorans TaxID=870486 RepID=A0ABT8WWW0_9FLAO|nr:alpha-L-fucosidase [Flavivirga amylovorans]MDO5985840.1 alpha-L-fucosidase [Flavivirga amylovorans]